MRCLEAILLAAAAVAPAGGYWSAFHWMDQRSLEEALDFGDTVLAGRAAAPESLRQVGVRLAALDGAGLYEVLGKADDPSPVHVSTASMRRTDAGLRFALRPGPTASESGPSHFGDWQATVTATRRTDDDYGLAVRADMDLAALRLDSLVRVMGSFLAQMHRNVSGQAEGDVTPLLLRTLRADFPRTMALAERYVKIDHLADVHETLLEVNAQLRFDDEALARDYPHLADSLAKLEGTVAARADTMTPDGLLLWTGRFDGAQHSVRLGFATKDGVVVPTRHGVSEPGRPLPLAEEGSRSFRTLFTASVDVDGLTVDVRDFPLALTEERGPKAYRLTMAANRMPERFDIGGALYGFLPLWAIDLLLPGSSLEETSRAFLQAMVKGRGGRGLELALASAPADGRERLVATADTDVLSNGMIRFAMGLKARLGLSDDDAQAELADLVRAWLHALREDYRASNGT